MCNDASDMTSFYLYTATELRMLEDLIEQIAEESRRRRKSSWTCSPEYQAWNLATTGMPCYNREKILGENFYFASRRYALRALTVAELRRYVIKPCRTWPASERENFLEENFMEMTRQGFPMGWPDRRWSLDKIFPPDSCRLMRDIPRAARDWMKILPPARMRWWKIK